MTLSGPIALIKKSFDIFLKKENFIYFLKISVPLLVFGLVSFIWSLIVTFGAEKLSESLATNPIFIFSITLLGIVNSLIYLVVSIALIIAIKGVHGGSVLSIREVYLAAKALIWKYLLMGALKGVILFFGFLLLIIPGVIFSVWFAFTGMEIVIDNASAKESFSKSKALVKGRFWPVAGRFLVLGLFAMIFQVVIVSLPYSLGTLISPAFVALFILPTYLLFRELEAQG